MQLGRSDAVHFQSPWLLGVSVVLISSCPRALHTLSFLAIRGGTMLFSSVSLIRASSSAWGRTAAIGGASTAAKEMLHIHIQHLRSARALQMHGDGAIGDLTAMGDEAVDD